MFAHMKIATTATKQHILRFKYIFNRD